jgi:hypothetical protein
MAVSDDLEPSDEMLVVITATRDGEVVVTRTRNTTTR